MALELTFLKYPLTPEKKKLKFSQIRNKNLKNIFIDQLCFKNNFKKIPS